MRFVIRLTIFLLIAGLVLAQTATSRITGTVNDASGALVPGAMVTARNEATGVTYTQTTTEAGLYGFPSLPVGTYTITVTLPGFKTATKTGNTLEVNTPLVINMSLEVGGITETVSIAAETEVLQTTNAVIGNVVERKAIADLPLNGRNPLALIALEPGVVQRSAGAAGSGIHVNGARDRSVNVTVDGIEANESSVPNPLSNLYRLNPITCRNTKSPPTMPRPKKGATAEPPYRSRPAAVRMNFMERSSNLCGTPRSMRMSFSPVRRERLNRRLRCISLVLRQAVRFARAKLSSLGAGRDKTRNSHNLSIRHSAFRECTHRLRFPAFSDTLWRIPQAR